MTDSFAIVPTKWRVAGCVDYYRQALSQLTSVATDRLQTMVDRLIEMRDHPGTIDHDYGICFNVNTALPDNGERCAYAVVSLFAVGWEFHSGDIHYIVNHKDTIPNWRDSDGRKRRHLISYLIYHISLHIAGEPTHIHEVINPVVEGDLTT